MNEYFYKNINGTEIKCVCGNCDSKFEYMKKGRVTVSNAEKGTQFLKIRYLLSDPFIREGILMTKVEGLLGDQYLCHLKIIY